MDKLNEFYNYLTNEKRYSLNTVNAYKRDLNDFNLYLKKESETEVNEFVIKNYLAYLYSLSLSKKTISRRISSLKSYYKFLLKKYNIKNNFINEIKCPKKDKLLPDMIYKDEVNKILEYSPNGKFCYRNKSILHLLYSSGVRVSELCNITLASINLVDRYLIVTGKGNKTRICPFSKTCKQAIENYIHLERNNIAKADNEYLLINKYGDNLTTRSIENIISKISFELFGNKKLHPHIFRHTYATQLLNNGADLRIVQELLGHSSLMTTQVYTHLAKEEINKIYKGSHPRN